MGFLTAAYRRSAKRIRLEQLVLLGIRVVIMILFCLAVARPFLGSGHGGGLGQAIVHRVLILDDSYSMGMSTGLGQNAFDLARSAALRLLERFGRDDALTIIRASRPASVLVDQSRVDYQAVAGELRRVVLSNATTDIGGALSRASEVLADSRAAMGNRAVYVITDGTLAAWSEKGGSDEGAIRRAAGRLAAGAALTVIDVGPSNRDNVSLCSLKPASPALSADWPVTLDAEVANHSARDISGLRLQIHVDGNLLRSESVDAIQGKATRSVRFRVELPGPGSHQVYVRLDGSPPERNVLVVDDTRWVPLSIRKEVPVLLVDGRPAIDRFVGQTGYLVTALAPSETAGGRPLVNPRTIMPTELSSEPLSDYVVIALCNVRELGRQFWRDLEQWVREGGGLLVFPGDQVNQEDYNRFGYDDGRGILPGPIVGISGRTEDRDRYACISTEGLMHPIVADFADQPRSGLFLARFYRYHRMNVSRDQGSATVLLRYENGDVAMASRQLGQGRVVMAAFPANMEWTNLPAKGDYVSLVFNTLAWLAGDPAERRAVWVGQSFTETLPGRSTSTAPSVLLPNGQRSPVEVIGESGADRMGVRFSDTRHAGAHQLMVGTQAIDFAVNVEPWEGDLSPVSEEKLREVVGHRIEYVRGVDDAVNGVLDQAHREVGLLLLGIVVGLLVLETLLAQRFGHHRDGT